VAAGPRFACGLYSVEVGLLTVQVFAIRLVAKPDQPAPGVMVDLVDQRHSASTLPRICRTSLKMMVNARTGAFSAKLWQLWSKLDGPIPRGLPFGWVQQAGEEGMYPVHLRIDDGNFTIRLAMIRDWLHRHRIDPGLLHYRMGADHVRVRIEFTKPDHATAFRAAFGEAQLNAAAD
jgi:hypothetical protein